MATYPSHDQLLGSRRRRDNQGVENDFAPGGTQHTREYQSQPYWQFALVHFLTQAQFVALEAIYDAGPGDEHDLVWTPEDSTSPETLYKVKFLAAPEQVSKENEDGWFVTTRLRGYKA